VSHNKKTAEGKTPDFATYLTSVIEGPAQADDQKTVQDGGPQSFAPPTTHEARRAERNVAGQSPKHNAPPLTSTTPAAPSPPTERGNAHIPKPITLPGTPAFRDLPVAAGGASASASTAAGTASSTAPHAARPLKALFDDTDPKVELKAKTSSDDGKPSVDLFEPSIVTAPVEFGRLRRPSNPRIDIRPELGDRTLSSPSLQRPIVTPSAPQPAVEPAVRTPVSSSPSPRASVEMSTRPLFEPSIQATPVTTTPATPEMNARALFEPSLQRVTPIGAHGRPQPADSGEVTGRGLEMPSDELSWVVDNRASARMVVIPTDREMPTAAPPRASASTTKDSAVALAVAPPRGHRLAELFVGIGIGVAATLLFQELTQSHDVDASFSTSLAAMLAPETSDPAPASPAPPDAPRVDGAATNATGDDALALAPPSVPADSVEDEVAPSGTIPPVDEVEDSAAPDEAASAIAEDAPRSKKVSSRAARKRRDRRSTKKRAVEPRARPSAPAVVDDDTASPETASSGVISNQRGVVLRRIEAVSKRLSSSDVDASVRTKVLASVDAARREASHLRYRAALEHLNAAEQALGPP